MDDVIIEKHVNSDGVLVTTYRCVEQKKSWWQKIKDWFAEGTVTPYVDVKDLNNSADSSEENKPKPAAEIGLKIRF